MNDVVKPPLEPMEAVTVEEMPLGWEWQYEPKWDGFRCLIFRDGDNVFLQSKSKPLARYFPEVVANVLKLRAKHFVQRRSAPASCAGVPIETCVVHLCTTHPRARFGA